MCVCVFHRKAVDSRQIAFNGFFHFKGSRSDVEKEWYSIDFFHFFFESIEHVQDVLENVLWIGVEHFINFLD